jgi:Rieske Fe-S protein
VKRQQEEQGGAAGPGGTARPITRRNFIVWYLAGLLTALAVAVLAPLLVYIWPTGSKVKKATVTVNLSQSLEQLQESQALQFNAPANFGFMMIDGGGDNYPGKVTFGAFAVRTGSQVNILSVTCSHLGCSVNYDTTAHIFGCPCHGSQFNIDGQVVHGPALAGLSHLGWKQGSSPNQIIVQGYSLQGVG